MVESAARGRIFISYRREDTAYPAGWLFDRLVDHYGDGQVFKDVDSIEPGDDFVDVVITAVASCDVLLALIGTQWLTLTDEDGQRRIDHPGDFVRLEIETALSNKVRVVPILVGGAQIPGAGELPASLAPLSRRNALELSPSRFEFETSRLLRVIDETLGGQPAPLPATPAKPPARKRLLRSRRARILAGVGALVALAVIAALVVTLGSGGSSPQGSTFRDDFSSQASGWDDTGALRNGGHYVDGAYRLFTAYGQDHFSDVGLPHKATSVFPSAPRDVKVDVLARRLAGGTKDAGYGILCRAAPDGSSYYQFVIWTDHVEIAKVTPDYALLQSENLPAMNPNGENRLQAVCTTDKTGAAHLVFSVNGQVVTTATDGNGPLPNGTVGLVVATGGAGASPIEAQFDDFVVTPA